jgi:exonuclease SbcD
MAPVLKILHTSDWHLGRALGEKKRYTEYESFLSWLCEIIDQEQINVLLVAGDIFDSGTPSNRAQELYYRFLCRIASSSCSHVIVIAGNHDSPSFLNAPKELLKALSVHVIGAITQNLEDEVLLLYNKDGAPELIVCAVPYLRDRDIRVAEAGESMDDKERKLAEGIRSHYLDVCTLAYNTRQKLGIQIPIIAMGHLFTAGGQTASDDGERELYIGSLARVSAKIFPDCIDYLALGHLHIPQKVNKSEVMRYSGSPLHLGFGEAKQEKSICIIEFAGINPSVKIVKVPVFQKLELIRGNWDTINSGISELALMQTNVWLEVIYDAEEIICDLQMRLENAVHGTNIEILRIRNNRIIDRALNKMLDNVVLDDMDDFEVFNRCLAAHQVPQEQQQEIIRAYQEIVTEINEKDKLAE